MCAMYLAFLHSKHHVAYIERMWGTTEKITDLLSHQSFLAKKKKKNMDDINLAGHQPKYFTSSTYVFVYL